MSSKQRKGLKWLSIVGLLATTVAVLLTRAECSAGHPVAECVGAVVEVIAAAPTPSIGVGVTEP